jgi:hypothetical protein
MKDVINNIKSQNMSTFFIIEMSYGLNTFQIFKNISKNNNMYTSLTPPSGDPFSNIGEIGFIEKWVGRLKLIFNPKRLINTLFLRIPISIFNIKHPEFVYISGGAVSKVNSQIISNETEVFHFPMPVYEEYEKITKHHKSTTKDNFIVFVDQNLPFAMDAFYDGDYKKKPLDPYHYYNELNVFFDTLQNLTGLEVIIAAHPKSNYKKNNYFKDRKFEINKTAELIKNSQLVIGHYSLGLYHAVLFEKPILFFTTNRLNKNGNYRYIESFSNFLGKTPLNISNKEYNISLEGIMSINKGLYNNFIKNYIKKDTGTAESLLNVIIEKISSIQV